jgi:TolB-like protein/Tfp pilus assembly protein PilF
VLPFANLSADPAQDYLADALTDQLTTALARIPESFVIARNTAYTFKGRPVDAKAIGKDLGVRFVLEGSVLPSGNQVRVNAQLIDADSGAHLWADQFDTARADLLQMQDEIVARLAHALELQASELAAARLKRTPVANPAAEDLALQCYGTVIKNGYVGREADAGYRLCEQALAADPNNAAALAVLSIKFWFPVAVGRSVDPKGDLRRGDELVSRALALDPNFAGAHAIKANIPRVQGRPDEAIAESERALALDPSSVDSYGYIGGAYMQPGQFEKWLEFTDKAIRLSPHDSALIYWYEDKATDYIGLGQYDQAIEWARRAVAVDPNNPSAHYSLGRAYAHLGQADKALEEYDKGIELTPQGSSVSAYYREKAQVYFGLKQYDQAIEWARRAIVVDPADWSAHTNLIAALALTGRQVEAQEALRHYLTLSSGGPKTINGAHGVQRSIRQLERRSGSYRFFQKENGRPAPGGDAREVKWREKCGAARFL